MGNKLIRGVNDLATVNPELAKQWHPTKNGDLKPEDICANSGKKAWWLLPYDDIETGKHFNFEWEAIIVHRNKGSGCPFLVGKAVWPNYNDLATINPELAAEWHPTKNGKLTSKGVTPDSGKKVWWYLPYDDPKTGKHFDFEWQTTIIKRNKGLNCPYLSGQAVWLGFNDLATVNPKLAAEWHPTKNGKLTPKNVTVSSNRKVWWLLSYDDPNTSKHFDFEWEEKVCNRNNGSGCPFLSGQAVWPGYNDLETVNPELTKEWHPTKNENLTPKDITIGSNKKIWWLLPYDDPNTGKHFDFEWQSTIADRSKGHSCPFLSGQAVWPGYNDLGTINPELVKEWHPTKNGNLTPSIVTPGSHKLVWWLYRYYDDETNQYYNIEWQATVCARSRSNKCPYITASKTTIFIQNLLKSKNITFIREKTFPNLKNINPLRFDVFVNNKYMIEIDGEQHFHPIKKFGNKDAFKQRIKHDNLKNQYCYDNNIPLLRIPYIYDPVIDKEKIENFVLDFITTGEIPQEIIDFYSQYKFSNYVNCIKPNTLLEIA